MREIYLLFVLFYFPMETYAQAYPTGEKRFPAMAVVNVKQVYGAIGDGQTDDTEAIQKAIRENAGKDYTIYFPNGTYLISQSLEWKSSAGHWRARLIFQGQSQTGTILRLKDHSPAFADKNTPRPFLATGSNPVNKQESVDGSGNNTFNNLFYDLTIHTGSHNPGVVALDFVGTNMAGARNVTLRSGDGQGVAGIVLKREGGGPCLFKNITIEGFDYGIDVYRSQYSQTYEYLTLKNQRKAAIRNTGNVLSLRKVHSETVYNAPAIINANRNDAKNSGKSGNYGLITLLDSYFIHTGKSPAASAVVHEAGQNNRKGGLYIRNVGTRGYSTAIQNNRVAVKGTQIHEYVNDPVLSNAPGKVSSFSLPIEETPDYHQNDLSQWASVTDYGASADDPYGDDSKGIQAAIDSGKEIIFFPKGKHRYNLQTTIVIRGNVRQLIGMQSSVDIGGNTLFADSTQSRPLFRFETGRADTVFFERFNLSNQRKSPFEGGIFLEHASAQTLVLRDLNNDVYAKGHYFYQNRAGAGKLFIENVASITAWHFTHAQHVWARQLNAESHHVPVGKPIIYQNQGTLWVLGLKTEGPRTVIQSTDGSAEVLGGFLYPVRAIPTQKLPAFAGAHARMKLTYVIHAYQPTSCYTLMAQDSQQRSGQSIPQRKPGNRGAGVIVPLYILDYTRKNK